jgi:hypothetical protein
VRVSLELKPALRKVDYLRISQAGCLPTLLRDTPRICAILKVKLDVLLSFCRISC